MDCLVATKTSVPTTSRSDAAIASGRTQLNRDGTRETGNGTGGDMVVGDATVASVAQRDLRDPGARRSHNWARLAPNRARIDRSDDTFE